MQIILNKKMVKIFFILMGLGINAFANHKLAPPPFDYQGSKSVFIDFDKANYQIEIADSSCVLNKTACTLKVSSKILFHLIDKGRPLFDLVPKIESAALNGVPVTVSEIYLPGNFSKARRIERDLAPGQYTLQLTHTFSFNVESKKGLEFGFWYLDLVDRNFMELYLPANFEFDQFPISLFLKLEGINDADYTLAANGKVTSLGRGEWIVDFPAFYTASSLYLHFFKTSTKKIQRFNYTSVDGRVIPILSYADPKHAVSLFSKKIKKMMSTYERDFGPWGHDFFIGYESQQGGMEYPGATRTSYFALDHEMLHSYFAKGVLPANGNSGWLDEAIAKWHDYGYPRVNTMCFEEGYLGSHSQYVRKTDADSYKQGGQLMAYLNYLLSVQEHSEGGLKFYLRKFFEEKKYQVITTEDFIESIKSNSGLDLKLLFDSYIFGVPVSPTELESAYGGNLTGNNSYQCFLWKLRYKLIKW